MKGKILILVLGLILTAAACNRTETPAETTGQNTETPSPTPQPTPPAESPAGATINMTADGFSPSTITVSQGETVTFVNQSTREIWPASAPHPTHTDYPEFDPKASVPPGASWSFTFTQTGTWRFHDHLNPSQFGSVTVN